MKKNFLRVVAVLLGIWAVFNAIVFVAKGWELDNGLAALGAGLLAYAYQRPQMVATFALAERPARDVNGIALAFSGALLLLASWLVDPSRLP